MKFLKTILIMLAVGVLSAHFDKTVILLIASISEGEGFDVVMTFLTWTLSMAATIAGLLWLLFSKAGELSSRDATLIKALRTQTNEAQKNMELSKVLIARLDAFNELWIIHPNGMVELKSAFIRDETVELSTPGTGGPSHKNVHADDHAVDMFAAAMKAKLALKREQGASGWEIAEPEMLEFRLTEQANKPHIDPIDVANYAAFLWNRN